MVESQERKLLNHTLHCRTLITIENYAKIIFVKIQELLIRDQTHLPQIVKYVCFDNCVKKPLWY